MLRIATQLAAYGRSAFGLRAFATKVAVDPTSAPVRRMKPTTPSMRSTVLSDRTGLHKGGPVSQLTQSETRKSGRNHHGRITVRHLGGAKQKRIIRLVDFTRSGRLDVAATVQRLEYDPTRSAYLALIKFNAPQPENAPPLPGTAAAKTRMYNDLQYILCAQGLRAGDQVVASRSGPVPIERGNATLLRHMPPGTVVHNIEMKPGRGGQLCRAAGTSAMVLNKDEGTGRAMLRLASGELRSVLLDCMATVGRVGNIDHHNRKIGNAGRWRRLGHRPTVRGFAMNAVDHPQGGKGVGGDRGTDPWGKTVKGQRTVRGKRVKLGGLRREIVQSRRAAVGKK